jgi:hypothetical protein
VYAKEKLLVWVSNHPDDSKNQVHTIPNHKEKSQQQKRTQQERESSKREIYETRTFST